MEAAHSSECWYISVWQKTAVFNAFNVWTWNILLFGCSWCTRINIIKSSRTALWPKKDVPWKVAMTVLEVAHFLLTVAFPCNPSVCC